MRGGHYSICFQIVFIALLYLCCNCICLTVVFVLQLYLSHCCICAAVVLVSPYTLPLSWILTFGLAQCSGFLGAKV